MQHHTMINRNKRLIGIMLAATLMLMVPAVAMLFTEEARWDETDFIVAGTLLLGTGLLVELVARKAGNLSYRAGAGLGLLTALVIVWANLAVGMIGSEDNPANLMYIAVLAVAALGSAIGRF